jgi:hypothetical protein
MAMRGNGMTVSFPDAYNGTNNIKSPRKRRHDVA